jgi:DNA repair exonuclease SbcCD ATPase subunit
MENKGAPPGMIETQLRAWAAELDRLKAKVEKELSEAKAGYYEHIEELRDDIEAQLKKWGKELESFEPRTSAQEAVQELRRNIQAELSALEPEIEALKTKAGAAEAEAKKLINELKARRKVLKEKVSEFKHASGGAWGDVKTGATRAWEELRPALRNAISKFK